MNEEQNERAMAGEQVRSQIGHLSEQAAAAIGRLDATWPDRERAMATILASNVMQAFLYGYQQGLESIIRAASSGSESAILSAREVEKECLRQTGVQPFALGLMEDGFDE